MLRSKGKHSCLLYCAFFFIKGQILHRTSYIYCTQCFKIVISLLNYDFLCIALWWCFLIPLKLYKKCKGNIQRELMAGMQITASETLLELTKSIFEH